MEKNGVHYKRTVARVVARAFHGKPPFKNCNACHNDGNPRNNFYKNIRWDTQKGNIHDKFFHGTRVAGEKCHAAVLTNKQAKEIKKQLKNYKFGMVTQLAKQYNVGIHVISSIKIGRTWNSIKKVRRNHQSLNPTIRNK